MDYLWLYAVPFIVFIALFIARAVYYMMYGVNAPSDVSLVFLGGLLGKCLDRIKLRRFSAPL